MLCSLKTRHFVHNHKHQVFSAIAHGSNFFFATAMGVWPNFLEIGPPAYGFRYRKVSLDTDAIYICSRSSEYAQEGECLILTLENSLWVAYDGRVSSTGSVELRQPVFRTMEVAIAPGWHHWEINNNANRDQTISSATSWQVMRREFETRVFNGNP